MSADESTPGSDPDVPNYVREALCEYLLNTLSDRLLIMEYERRYLKIDFGERRCESCDEDADHRIEKDTYQEVVRTECSNCGHQRRVEYATDGGVDLPETLSEFVQVAEEKDTLECRVCGEEVERRYLEDGRCVGCQNGPGVHAPPRTDGGEVDGEVEQKYEQFEEKSDELWEGLEESYAAGFLKAVETFDIDAPTPDTVEQIRSTKLVSESHYYYWDGKTLPLEFWLQEQFGVGIAAEDDDD